VPTSPIATTCSSISKPAASDPDASKSPSPRPLTRSISPRSRGHRRSISSHMLPKSSIGLSHKKKRVPAPLRSTEYHSDESSSDGSPPRSERLRDLAASSTEEFVAPTRKVSSVEREIGNATLLGNPSPVAGLNTHGGGFPSPPPSWQQLPSAPSLPDYIATRIKQEKISRFSEAAQVVQQPPKLDDNITTLRPQLPSAAHNAPLLSDSRLETGASRPRRKLIGAAERRAERERQKQRNRG
jgi:hypothetical protein